MSLPVPGVQEPTAWASALAVALVAIAGLLLVLSLVVVARRAWRRHALRQREALVEPLRPLLIELVAADEPDPQRCAPLLALDERSWRAVEPGLTALLGKVRGDAHAALVELLERRGTLGRASRQTRRRSAAARGTAAELLGSAGASSGSAGFRELAGGAATRVVPDLVRLLRDPDPDVRLAAARSLGRVGAPSAAPALLASLDAERPVPAGVVAHALARLGPGAHPGLLAAATSPAEQVRAVAVEILGIGGAVAATATLADRLARDPSADVRGRAARALGRLGMPAGLEPLLTAAAAGQATPLRVAAVRALGELGDLRAVDPLVELLGEDQHAVLAAAAQALLRLAPAGPRALREVAAGARGARAASYAQEALAAAALGGRGSPEPQPLLVGG